MGKTLIIAEKPSLAKNIVAAISDDMTFVKGTQKNTGYYQNKQYIVSYAFGHLFGLCDAEDYDASYKEWSVESLPIIPESFKFKLRGDDGPKAQYKLLASLIKDENVDRIVNAGDSDREGEIIIRNIIRRSGSKKPVYRLWMPDQTQKTILAELKAMKPDSDYDNLANEGYARTYIDWMYGINLTRLATKKADKLLRVGRVTSPIITAICEREREIRNFVPEKYYVAQHDADGLKLTSETKCKTKEECVKLCEQYNKAKTFVQDKKKVKKTLPRPKLFALSDLQGLAGKNFKLSPKETLDIVQELYEAGYVTYPRTDSQYMADNEKDRAKEIIAAVKAAVPTKLDGIGFRDSKEIFDSSKVEAHSGITPTTKFPDYKKLTVQQKKVYGAILARFAAVFCKEEYTVDRTTLSITNGIENFSIVGDVVLTPGYTIFEPNSKKDTVIPPLSKGDIITPAFAPIEKETVPPSHYTAESLNKFLKNPFSKDEKKELSGDTEAKEIINDIELGTEATRAGLIENAIKSGYITLENNRYGITADGEYYVDTLSRLKIDMTKGRTLEFSKYLKMVYRNQMNIEEVISKAKSDLAETCTQTKAIKDVKLPRDASKAASNSGNESNILCKCPKCGNNVMVYSKAYSCSNRECTVVLFKDTRFLSYFGKKMTMTMAKEFITNGSCTVKGMVSPKTGTAFNAKILVSFDSKYPDFKFDISNPTA